jgi:lipopolysaccharide export system permease protein
MAVLVSTLYAFSRLASENEVTAMKASGVGLARLLIPVMAGGAVLALAMILFNDQILPRANHRLSTLQRDIASKKPTFALKEQVINEVKKGSLSLRAARIDRATNRMHDVMILDYSDQTSRKTIYADSGDLAFTPDERDLQLVLFNGEMVETNQAEPGRLQRLFFATNTVKIEGVGNTLQRSDDNGQYKSDRERTICDMQNELAAAELDHRAMSGEVRALMTAGARQAATGQRQRMNRAAPDSTPSWGLGRVYCTVLGAIAPPLAKPDANANGSYIRSIAASQRYSASADTAALAPEGDQLTAELEAARSVAVSRLEERNAFDVEIQKKFSIAVACMVFILIGAPVALRFPRGGVGLVIGVSLGVFALYYVGLIAGEDLADKNIVPPFAAMWVTNLILTFVGVVLLARMGKEGSTARGGDMSELFDSMRAWMAGYFRRIGLRADRRRRAA